MRKLVMLNRSFLFDPAEVGWIRVSEFNKSLTRWLDSIGLQGEEIELMGQPESGVVKVTKKEEVPGIKEKPEPVKSTKQQFKTVMSQVKKGAK